VTSIMDGLETTKQVETSKDPFQMIVGQENAVSLVRSAVKQRRHVLLCGVPGIGKSMLAKAAYSLLDPPKEEIHLVYNPALPDRPDVIVVRPEHVEEINPETEYNSHDAFYITPDRLPFEIAIKMGFRCPSCGHLSTPEASVCVSCESEKRFDWAPGESYHELFRMLDVVREPALEIITSLEDINGESYHVMYERVESGEIKVSQRKVTSEEKYELESKSHQERVLIPLKSSRFIRVSGASPVELLGDVKHDPYGSAESLGLAAHQRVVPGAIHEAHEGILYIDEIASLGSYQSHLLTAMQDRVYSISGHNPLSSGAAVRVSDVPCDFLLFASCNVENLKNILPPLRSRIRGYGYEIMLDSWTPRNEERVNDFVRFMSQTVEEDGKIPHLTVKAVEHVLEVAEEMALRLDGQKDAFTLRLRELGGLIRIAGDLAVRDGSDLVLQGHVQQAEVLSRGIDENNLNFVGHKSPESSISRDYFF
ncbi:MAG: ATP-binding protein, partial [Promethearchaeota archaeon]